MKQRATFIPWDAFILACTLVLLAPALAGAQTTINAIGRPQNAATYPVEHGFVNTGDGNLHLEVPIESYPQRGDLSVPADFVYDSSIWQIVNNPEYGLEWYPATADNGEGYGSYVYGLGWTFQYNRYYIANANVQSLTCPTNGSNSNVWVYSNISWNDANGTLHTFPIETISAGTCVSSKYPNTPSGQGYATDGSGYYATVTNYTNLTAWDSKGTKVVSMVIPSNGGSGAASVDRNGNYVNYDVYGDLLSDSLNRTPIDNEILEYDANGYPAIEYLYVPTVQGQTAQYTVTYENIGVHTAFDKSGTLDFYGYINVIQSIGLPDGTSYQFNYDAVCTGSSCLNSGNYSTIAYGELTSVTMPHGGTAQYSYQSDSNAGSTEPARWVASHAGSDGQTSFQYSYLGSYTPTSETGGYSCGKSSNIVKNAALQTAYIFSNCSGNILPMKILYSPASNPSTVDRFVLYHYDFSTACQVGACSGAQWTNLTGKTTVLPSSGTYQSILAGTSGSGLISDVQYQYGTPGSGIPTAEKEWDFYSGSYPTSLPDSPSGTATREVDQVLGYSSSYSLLPTDVTKKDASGAVVWEAQYSYDESGHLVSSPGSTPNHSNSLAASSRGNVTTIQQIAHNGSSAPALKTSIVYDDAGEVSSVTDPNLHVTNFAYDSTDTYPQTITEPSTTGLGGVQVSHVLHRVYDFNTGVLTSSTDENSQTTSYGYDSNGRLSSIGFTNGGSQVSLETVTYPSANETDVSQLQSSGVSIPSSTIVDGFGRTTQTSREGISTDTTYDVLGRVYSVTNPHGSSGSSTDGTTYYTYDELSRPLSVSLPNGHATTYTYSLNNVTITDALQHKRQLSFDAFNDISQALEPDSIGALNWTTAYQYNGLGQPTRIDQKGGTSDSSQWRTRTFTYDGFSRLYTQTTPEAGTLTFGYDSNGNVTSTQNQNSSNNTTTFTYDALNRVLTKAVAGGPTYIYTYDAQDQSGDSYGKGLLTNVSNGSNVQMNFKHDPLGRIISEAYCMPSSCSFGYIIQAAYDFQSNVTSLTYPDGRNVKYAYDLLNRPTSVTYASWNGTTVNASYLSGVAYFPPGELQAATYGNGVQVSATFDGDQNVSALSYSLSGASLAAKQFTWDYNAVNLLKIIDSAAGRTQTYTYDQLNRLASVTDTGTTSSGTNPNLPAIPAVSETYTLDAWGNLNQSGSFTFAQPIGSNNRISEAGYTYDSAGNMTLDGLGTSYQYRSDGLPSGAGGATYTYDALGQRVRKDGSISTEYFYYGGMLAATRDPASGAWTDLIYGGGRFLASVPGTQTATPSYRIGDHLDSLANTVNSSGSITGTTSVTPYGQLAINSAGDSFPFTDHLRDGESGSDYTIYRHYSPAQGRWMAPDPYNGNYDFTDPQSLNRYAYLNNRPMGAIDPFGLDYCYYDSIWTCVISNPGGGSGGLGYNGGAGDNGSGGGDYGGSFGSNNIVSYDYYALQDTSHWYALQAFRYSAPGANVTADSTVDAANGTESLNPFLCGSENAAKVSLANGINHIPGATTLNRWTGGASGFVTDAIGGNAFSGATDLIHSLATGEGGGHSVFYNMSESVVAGPTQGFGSAFARTALGETIEDSPWGADLVSVGLKALPVVGEYATGIGEAKFAYDALTYFGATAGCALGIFH